jgi:uncharacterized membrane protein (DUF2068 family)
LNGYNPSPSTRPRPPGQVIAVSVVLVIRGALGLLLTYATLQTLQLQPVASWIPDALWFSMGFAIAQIVSGLFLWLRKPWPQMLGLGVLALDIVLGLFIMVMTNPSCPGFSGIAVDVAIIAMLFRPAVRQWCY